MRQAYPGTQAVLRAVRLLKSFTPGRPTRGLAELSRESGLNRSTAYRLLTALESEGLLEREAEGEGWRLGGVVVTLGATALGATDLRAAAHVELTGLARSTRETASLEVRAADSVVVLEEAMGPHVVGTTPSVGERWPIHATSTGKAILAHLPGPELDDLLGCTLPALTPRTITDPAALRRDLVRVRERGYAAAVEELEPGYVAVAAPVWGPGGRLVGALSVGGPRSRLPAARIALLGGEVKASAARLSVRLGAPGGAPPRAGADSPRPRRRA